MKANRDAETRRAAFLGPAGKWRWLLGVTGLALAAAVALLLATGRAAGPEPAAPADAGLSAAAASAEAPPPMPPERSASAQPSAGDGPTAPDFSIVTTNGKTFRLSEQRGEVVVVNFNATG